MNNPVDTSALISLAKQSFSPHCDLVFHRVVPRYTKAAFFQQLESAPIEQYPVSSTRVPPHEFGADAETAINEPHSPIRLFPNFYATDKAYQAFVLVHEGVHRFTKWTDREVFNRFSAYGLQPPGAGYGTGNITLWLQRGCKP